MGTYKNNNRGTCTGRALFRCGATNLTTFARPVHCHVLQDWNTIKQLVRFPPAEERPMAEKKIYFQWQNEALLKTIYPLRTMNLRNALEYYMEIDLWQQYKDQKIEDMSEEVA